MKTFCKKVDMRTREAMIRFLRDHDRYWTMNSWNRSTSYANCVKIHSLGLTPEQLENAWAMLDMPQVYDAIHRVLEDWARKHEWRWQIGFNGRSGGYLVLYQGGLNWRNARTAQCDECGKLTWHRRVSASEGDWFAGRRTHQDTPCTTADCDGMLRVLREPRPQIVTYPGRGLDEDEDFGDWAIEDLRDRVRLVQDFDRACDVALAEFFRFCDGYRVVEKDILVPKTVKALEPG